MLIKRAHLDGIVRGEVDLAFRRWKRPTVRAGGTLNTAVGQLAIESVDAISEKQITNAAARRAGYESREPLLRDLTGGTGRALYRIRLKLAGPDPRVALRGSARLTREDVEAIRERLERLDSRSRRGPWTAVALDLISRRPSTLAAKLAASAGMETSWFKGNVRKLKALGLTESLNVGYRLSPRGQAFLRRNRRTRR